MARMWMVRGEGGSLYDAFRECGVAAEILAALKGKPAPVVEDEAEEVIADLLTDIESQALERIKDRASFRWQCWTLYHVVRALIEHYDGTDAETKRIVPLKRLYWPA